MNIILKKIGTLVREHFPGLNFVKIVCLSWKMVFNGKETNPE
jgi:hypothetical protein